MPRLRALNFELVKNGDKAEITKMVKDILMLYPRGPLMQNKKPDYTVYQSWRGKRSYLTTTRTMDNWTEDQPENWGYTAEQMYYLVRGLGHEGNSIREWNFQSLLTSKIPDLCMEWSGTKWTRTSKRLADRIAGSYAKACKSGQLGDLLWNVDIATRTVTAPRGIRWSWDSGAHVTVTVPARTPDEAQMLVDTCFGHAVEPTNRRNTPTGWAQGGDAEAMVANQATISELTSKREKWLEIIAKAQQQIENIDMLSEAIELYSMSAFGTDDDNEDN